MSFCSILNPIIDLLQSIFNAIFAWAPSVGLQVPVASTLFGNLLGCGGTTTAG